MESCRVGICSRCPSINMESRWVTVGGGEVWEVCGRCEGGWVGGTGRGGEKGGDI